MIIEIIKGHISDISTALQLGELYELRDEVVLAADSILRDIGIRRHQVDCLQDAAVELDSMGFQRLSCALLDVVDSLTFRPQADNDMELN